MRTTILALAGALLVSLTAAACGGSGSSSAAQPTGGGATTTPETASLPVDAKPFPIDPSEFTTEIDNPYWPMKPGSQWVFRETNAEGSVSRVVVTVLDKTKMIANGVEARIVHDQVTEGGQVAEDTYDWYAQDAAGNLWYLGEDTTTYEKGKPKTTEGSWEAGVDGALPGIIMPASQQVGMTYREEYYKGHAEDGASIISTDALAKVPYRRFEDGARRGTSSPSSPTSSRRRSTRRASASCSNSLALAFGPRQAPQLPRGLGGIPRRIEADEAPRSGRLQRRSGLAERAAQDQPEWDAHADWLDDLIAKGTFVMGGPLSDNSGSVSLLEGLTAAEAAELLATDPFVANGVFVLDSVRDWTVYVDGSSAKESV